MERLKAIVFGKKEPEKRSIRDSRGRPHYLQKLPLRYRYNRAFVFGGGVLTFCIVFSGPIYHMIFTKREDHPPEYFMWPKERHMGMTYAQQWRKKYGKPENQPQAPAPELE